MKFDQGESAPKSMKFDAPSQEEGATSAPMQASPGFAAGLHPGQIYEATKELAPDSGTAGRAWEGVKRGAGNILTTGVEAGKDVLSYATSPRPLLISDPEHGESLLHKYITAPAEAEHQKAVTAPTALESIGHSIAEAIPVLGPIAAHMGEEAGTGDVAGAVGEGATYALAPKVVGKGLEVTGKIASRLPVVGDVVEAAQHPFRTMAKSGIKSAAQAAEDARINASLQSDVEAGIPPLHPEGDFAPTLEHPVAYPAGKAVRNFAGPEIADLSTRVIDSVTGKTIQAGNLVEPAADWAARNLGPVRAGARVTPKGEEFKTPKVGESSQVYPSKIGGITQFDKPTIADVVSATLGETTRGAGRVGSGKPMLKREPLPEQPIELSPEQQVAQTARTPKTSGLPKVGNENVKTPGQVKPEVFQQEPMEKPLVPPMSKTMEMPGGTVRVGRTPMLGTGETPAAQPAADPAAQPYAMRSRTLEPAAVSGTERIADLATKPLERPAIKPNVPMREQVNAPEEAKAERTQFEAAHGKTLDQAVGKEFADDAQRAAGVRSSLHDVKNADLGALGVKHGIIEEGTPVSRAKTSGGVTREQVWNGLLDKVGSVTNILRELGIRTEGSAGKPGSIGKSFAKAEPLTSGEEQQIHNDYMEQSLRPVLKDTAATQQGTVQDRAQATKRAEQLVERAKKDPEQARAALKEAHLNRGTAALSPLVSAVKQYDELMSLHDRITGYAPSQEARQMINNAVSRLARAELYGKVIKTATPETLPNIDVPASVKELVEGRADIKNSGSAYAKKLRDAIDRRKAELQEPTKLSDNPADRGLPSWWDENAPERNEAIFPTQSGSNVTKAPTKSARQSYNPETQRESLAEPKRPRYNPERLSKAQAKMRLKAALEKQKKH